MSSVANVSFETTLLVRDTCLCLHMQRAARRLARRFDEALRPVNLTNGQFSLMMSLNRPQPASRSSVAALLGLDSSTLTAALKPLERRGLVQITSDPTDRRNKRLALTAEGREVLAAAVSIWKSTHLQVESQLKNSDPSRLRQDLQELA